MTSTALRPSRFVLIPPMLRPCRAATRTYRHPPVTVSLLCRWGAFIRPVLGMRMLLEDKDMPKTIAATAAGRGYGAASARERPP